MQIKSINKITAKFLILAVFAGFVVVALPSQAEETLQNSETVSATQLVVTEAAQTSLVTSKTQNLQNTDFAKCGNVNISSDVAVLHNAAVLNLNQPAECFSLSVKKEYSTSNVTVINKDFSGAVVKVVTPKAFITPIKIAQGPSKAMASTMAVGFVLFLIFDTIVFRKNKYLSLVKNSTNIKHQLGIVELNVLRC